MRVILILALLQNQPSHGGPDFGGDPPVSLRDEIMMLWRLLSENQSNR